MKLREAAAGALLVTTVAACGSGTSAESDPTTAAPSMSAAPSSTPLPTLSVPARHDFLPNAADSDYSIAVNCNSPETSVMGAVPTLYVPNAEVVTIGATDKELSAAPDPSAPDRTIHFLGGATIRREAENAFEIATSDGQPVSPVDLNIEDFSMVVPVEGQEYSVLIQVGTNRDGTIMTEQCVSATSSPQSSAVSGD
jgi:hypothetical protein